jgi:hypothetical protein
MPSLLDPPMPTKMSRPRGIGGARRWYLILALAGLPGWALPAETPPTGNLREPSRPIGRGGASRRADPGVASDWAPRRLAGSRPTTGQVADRGRSCPVGFPGGHGASGGHGRGPGRRRPHGDPPGLLDPGPTRRFASGPDDPAGPEVGPRPASGLGHPCRRNRPATPGRRAAWLHPGGGARGPPGAAGGADLRPLRAGQRARRL